MFDKFFELYADAFLNFNPSFVSDVYEFPMIFYTENGESVSFEETVFFENTQKLISLYEKIGVKNVTFEIDSNSVLSESLNLVSVVWHFRGSKDKEIYYATTRYIMKKTDSGLKIKSVIVVDETSKFSELISK